MAHSWWTGKPEADTIDEKPQKDFKPETLTVAGAHLASIGIPGRDGRRYIPYDLGQSILMLPADWIGHHLQPLFPKISNKDLRGLAVNFFMFIPLSVVAVVFCYWLLRELGFSKELASLSSLFWLISSTVLHYSQVIQQNNQVLLFILIGYTLSLKAINNNLSPLSLFCAGIALGFSVILRITSVLHALTVFLFFLACLFYSRNNYLDKKLAVAKACFVFALGFLLFIFIGRYLEFVRYGYFWKPVQSIAADYLINSPIFSEIVFPKNYPAIYSPLVGIFGVLLSPAKSIFIYDPILLPGLLLAFFLRKNLPPYLVIYIISTLLNIGLFTVLTSNLEFWHADASWGARYQVTSVHLALIPLIALLIQYMFTSRGWRVWAVKALFSLAIIIQILSTILFFGVESAQSELLPLELRYSQFRLFQRVDNIFCQFRAYQLGKRFLDNCVPDPYQQLKNRPVVESFLDNDQVAFIPFNYARFSLNRRNIFLVWFVLLSSGVLLLVKYCLSIASSLANSKERA
jgi:hypothetical protein